MSKRRHLIQRIAVVGLSHHAYSFHAQELQAGSELELVAVKDNSSDQYAIAVYHKDSEGVRDQIGWIPKGQNEMLHRLLSADLDIKCMVIKHDKNAALQTCLYVGNYIIVEE